MSETAADPADAADAARTALDARRTQVWRPSGDLAVVDDGDAVYVLDLARLAEDGVPRSIAGTGAELWRRLEGCTLGELVAAVAADFDADPAVIATDVLTFIDELADIGILVLAGDQLDA